MDKLTPARRLAASLLANPAPIMDAADDATTFTAQVRVSATVMGADNLNIEATPVKTTMAVPFTIDIEYKSWGIASISIELPPRISVPMHLENIDTHQQTAIDVEIDTSTVTVNRVGYGSQYTIRSLSIYIDKDGRLNPEWTEIEVVEPSGS